MANLEPDIDALGRAVFLMTVAGALVFAAAAFVLTH